MSTLFICLILGFLIFIHELGHFLAARLVGIPVARFAIGMGPSIWGFKRGGTEYCLCAIPLGGYVLPAIPSDSQWYRIDVPRRLFFFIAGPLANVLLAVPLFALYNTLTEGATWSNVLLLPWEQTGAMFAEIVASLSQIFWRVNELSGVIGIVSIGQSAVGLSVTKGLLFAILLSVNLAVFNLLPIPVLDGGKIMLALAELIHPQARRLQTPLSLAGLLLLAVLFLYTTIADIGRLFT